MNEATEALSRKSRISSLARAAVMTAVTCVLAPLSVPIGPVPISLTNFAIFLSLYVLNWKWATGSYLVYLVIGMVGMPVFSGFTGGLGKLVGPTGGYLVGFVPMAIITGMVIDKCSRRWVHFLAMILGTAICYAFGTAWFCLQSGTPVGAALSACVIPFIPGDLLKIVLVLAFGPMLRHQLVKAGLLKE